MVAFFEVFNTAVRLHLFENLLLESCYKKNRIAGRSDKKEKKPVQFTGMSNTTYITIMKGISIVSD